MAEDRIIRQNLAISARDSLVEKNHLMEKTIAKLKVNLRYDFRWSRKLLLLF